MDRVTEFLETEFPDAEERALLLGIVSALTDKTAKLVYADWLDDRADPRSEYVRSLVKNGRRKPTARMAELWKECSGPWLSMMGELHARFGAVTKAVEGRTETTRGYRPTALGTCDRGLWTFHYSGDLHNDDSTVEDNLSEILAFVCDPTIAPVLRSLLFDGHEDRGRGNGTLQLMLDPMTSGKISFPFLERFATEQGSGIIIAAKNGDYFEEGGELAKLLDACPGLRYLAVPSAPNADFFVGKTHPLEELDVHSGYDTERFIANLAKSKRFPNLRVLRYMDFCCGDYMAPEPRMCTPFAAWKVFFRSPVCAALEALELSDVVLTEAEVRSLLKLRSDGVRIDRSPAAP